MVQRIENRIDTVEFRTACSATGQMLGNGFALRRLPLSISDQFFFCQMFHSSVPLGSGAAATAFACRALRAPT